MRKLLVIRTALVLSCALAFTANGSVAATPQPFQCPVCGEKFEAEVSDARSATAGQDRDLMPRTWGEQPLLYEVVTCPHCLYSGYAKDFAEDVKIPAAIVQAIKANKALKRPAALADDVPADQLPAWARYDLLAQTLALKGKEGLDHALALLAASWCIRQAWYLPLEFSDAQMQEFADWEQKTVDRDKLRESANPAFEEIKLARSLAKRTGKASAKERLHPGLLAVYLLRTHGENEPAFAVLQLLKDSLNPAQYKQLGRSLEDSVELERHYQESALAALESLLKAKPDPGQRATIEYLCGELHRRLGNPDKAKRHFRAVRKNKAADERLTRWAKEQEELSAP